MKTKQLRRAVGAQSNLVKLVKEMLKANNASRGNAKAVVYLITRKEP
jgi:hypothetical protein